MNDELLIDLVERCPHLYNKAIKDFKDDRMKQNSWFSIAQALNVDVPTAKKRWENLRDRFVRAHREVTSKPPSGSAGGSKKTINFIYYNQMLWLESYLRKKRLTSSLRVEAAVEATVEAAVEAPAGGSVEVPVETEIEPELDVSEFYDVQEDGILSPTPSWDQPSSSSSITPTMGPTKKKSKLNLVNDQIHKTLDSLSSFMQSRLEDRPVQSSSDSKFMAYIIDEMAVLPSEVKIQFKREVMDLLMNHLTNFHSK